MTARPNTAAAPATSAPAPAPAATRSEKRTSLCRCGCGQPTIRDEADYRPGHDARHAGQVGRSLVAMRKDNKGLPTREALTQKPWSLASTALADKALGMVAAADDKAARQTASKAARVAAQAAAKAAYEAALRDFAKQA